MDTWYYGKPNFEGNKPHKLFQQEKYCPVNNFNNLQNNGASNYDCDSIEKKIQELILNGIID